LHYAIGFGVLVHEHGAGVVEQVAVPFGMDFMRSAVANSSTSSGRWRACALLQRRTGHVVRVIVMCRLPASPEPGESGQALNLVNMIGRTRVLSGANAVDQQIRLDLAMRG